MAKKAGNGTASGPGPGAGNRAGRGTAANGKSLDSWIWDAAHLRLPTAGVVG